jgi:hypothetical protein
MLKLRQNAGTPGIAVGGVKTTSVETRGRSEVQPLRASGAGSAGMPSRALWPVCP